MSTTIEIQCDGKTKQIDVMHPICRIGSNPSMELCIQGIDSHAATLRMQNSKRIIYNRSPKPLRIGKKSALPDQTVEWLDGEEILINDFVTMRLASSKHQRQAEPANTNAINPSFNSTTDSTTAGNKKQRNQLLLGFFLVFGLILFTSGSEDSNDAMNHDLGAIVSILQAAEREPNSGIYREIRFQIQNAVLRTNRRESYTQQLSSLLPKISNKPELRTQVATFMRNYLQ